MTISAVSNATASISPAPSTGSGANITSDYMTFLRMLTVQMQNQDPLNPQDGTAFVAQLAQFNSLEQLISINKRLGEVLGEK